MGAVRPHESCSGTGRLRLTVLRALCVAAVAFAAPVAAEPRAPRDAPVVAKPRPPEARARRAAPTLGGPDSVTLVAGQPGGTALDAAHDLSAALDGEGPRVLALIGSGGERNLADVVRTRGVDMAIVTTADLIRADPAEVGRRVVYIAKLYNAELHVLAREKIRHLTDLDGRRVNLGEAGGSSQAAARPVLDHFGIRVTELNLGQREAIARMGAEDGPDATFFLTGKPAALYAGLARAGGLHFLALPYAPSLGEHYYPASLGHSDYPGLIAEGETTGTVAVASALIAFDWPESSSRARRLSAFTTALFDRFERLRAEGRHPKWREVNLAAELSGWRRSRAAEAALARAGPAPAASAGFAAEAGPEERDKPAPGAR